MMVDPVVTTALLAGAAGGIAQEWARVAAGAVGRVLRGVPEATEGEALRNVQSLVALLARRTEEIEERVSSQEAIRETLLAEARNPDFSFTVQQALLGAARTNNPVRHEILARAVVERLLAAPDSIQAVAGTAAVEALARLSATHLELLGIAAFVYYIAPILHAPASIPDGLPGADAPNYQTRLNAQLPFAHKAVEEYAEWLQQRIRSYAGPEFSDFPSPSAMDFAHLASSGCVTYDRSLERSFAVVLIPPTVLGELNSAFSFSYQRLQHLDLHPELRKRLDHLWLEGLQHVTLTPSGLLIGSVVHELRSGDHVEVNWSLPLSDPFNDERPWDGTYVDSRFVDAIMPQIESRVQQKLNAQGRDGTWP